MKETEHKIIKRYPSAFKIFYQPMVSKEIISKSWKTGIDMCLLQNGEKVTVVWSENGHPSKIKSESCKWCFFLADCEAVSEELKV